MTMGVLAVRGIFVAVVSYHSQGPTQPYRSRGVGSKCLEHIIRTASTETDLKIDTIYLHVQVSNQPAKEFYERNGFKEISVYKDYYKKLEPHDAWVLERENVPAKTE